MRKCCGEAAVIRLKTQGNPPKIGHKRRHECRTVATKRHAIGHLASTHEAAPIGRCGLRAAHSALWAGVSIDATTDATGMARRTCIAPQHLCASPPEPEAARGECAGLSALFMPYAKFPLGRTCAASSDTPATLSHCTNRLRHASR
jgi:hypothetical protein